MLESLNERGTRYTIRSRSLAPLARRPADGALEWFVLLQPRDDLDTKLGIFSGNGNHAGDRGILHGIACLECGGVDHWSVGWTACCSGPSVAKSLGGAVVSGLAAGYGC